MYTTSSVATFPEAPAATEDVVYMLHGMGFNTGIDLDLMIDAGNFICKLIEKESRSKVAIAILAKRKNSGTI